MPSVVDTPLRIASASGSVTDRRHALAALAKDEQVQFIVGDWLSEYNMTTRGGGKVDGAGGSDEFEISFLEALEPALSLLDSRQITLVVNAGASDSEKLYQVVAEKIPATGLGLKVAWIGGDEVFDVAKKAVSQGNQFKSLTHGGNLRDWGLEPIYAQCYLGAWGIVEALKHGADIVLCGPVADASPTIACAAYHFGWQRDEYEKLASAFVAGHFIECSTYLTGGNFSGSKDLTGDVTNLAFPVVEMKSDGTFYVEQKNRGGMVTQLLYEIHDPLHYNPDVVAQLKDIILEQAGDDKVLGLPRKSASPQGGYQAEAHYFLCGLDIEEKASLLERQVRVSLDESKFHCLKFRAMSQDAATVDVRIFAQSRAEESLSTTNFFRPVTDVIMQSYTGATSAVDARQASPKPYYEYFVSILSQSDVAHVAHLSSRGLSIPIPALVDTLDFVSEQNSYETALPIDLASLGPTRKAPLGYVVHARSGDKGSDANVGFFVRATLPSGTGFEVS